VGGKLGRRAAAAVTAQPGKPCRLATLFCSNTNKHFLVDTGAVYSVIPHTSSAPAEGPAITTVSGTPIPCWGWYTETVRFGGRRFMWRFLLAAVAFPLLGADFLANFRMVVDLHNYCVKLGRDGQLQMVAPPAGNSFASVGVRPAVAVPVAASDTSTPTLHRRLYTSGSTPSALLLQAGEVSTAQPVGGGSQIAAAADNFAQPISGEQSTVIAAVSDFQELLQEFPAVTCASGRLPEVKHSVVHHIETRGRPVAAKHCRLDPVQVGSGEGGVCSAGGAGDSPQK
jgi:hypothetical protein